MAGGMDLGQGGKGGKKPLDTAINLVPFIDLMAVTISFLIMTAVWTQIGRLQVSSAAGPSDPDQEQDTKTVPVTLLITDKELKITAGATVYDPIAISRDSASNKMDVTKLRAKLKELKVQLPEQSNITVQAEDKVRYDDLVRVIDECISDHDGLPARLGSG